MQYFWKAFKLNGTIREDLTEFIATPVFLELRCNEQLPSGEIVFENMPTNKYPTSFEPKTKIIIERWVEEELNRSFDFLVDHDDVEDYVGCPEICCHRVTLIAASVAAQGVHCDNFSLTYEQNDSTLNYKTVISSSERSVPSNATITGSGMSRPGSGWNYGSTGRGDSSGQAWFRGSGNFTADYINSYGYRWDGIAALNNFMRNLNGLVANSISFQMPIVQCFWNTGGAVADYLFDCPTRCRVTRTTLRNGIVVAGTTTTVVNQLYSPSNVQNRNDRVMYNSGGRAGLRDTFIGRFEDGTMGPGSSQWYLRIFPEGRLSNFPAMINTSAPQTNRTISFQTTPLTQGDFDAGLSYRYDVSLQIEPFQSGAFVTQNSIRCVTEFTTHWSAWIIGWLVKVERQYIDYQRRTLTRPNDTSVSASVNFICRNMLEDAPSNPFLLKGRKYNCFDLFRRALLTCDTQIIDNNIMGIDPKYDGDFNDIGIQYPIEVDPYWMQRMKEAVMYESVFEGKNLWEVVKQIGYYLHAIPFLTFARDGKDRFILNFLQLGDTTLKNDDSTKITIFNSHTLDNFYTQYDAYVTNLFSPQNEIDEWVVCKTGDSSFLVSNDTAEIHTKYNITELVAFDITYNGVTRSALDFVFEKSVYDTLSAKTDFVPAKWSALFFTMGDNKIQGLNYVPPTVNNDGHMALKTIVGRVFANNVTPANLRFNDLRFRIRYKTQDELRITQIRPDLERFMKNSEFEKYPHHEQFFGQQDKIVDSERFSANLWGRLIRVANGVYQCQEYARPGQEKDPGDLVQIKGSNYYVTECENEYYPDAIFQKVTYSKNFNQLSQIVTIPSEPRFFEISERSMIRREVRLLDFIKLSTQEDTSPSPPKYINASMWHTFIRNLLFRDSGNATLPNFAYTNFKGDKWRDHHNLPNNDISVLFPKSEAQVISGAVQPMPSMPNTAVIVPCLYFPLRNALVIEWTMDDNFKAGDCVDITTSGNNNTADRAYLSLQPVRYTDVYGRADLFDFKLFHKNDWNMTQIRRLPFAEVGRDNLPDDFRPTASQSLILIPDNLSVGLDKDNREALSFNYQLNLLHQPHDTDREDFITYANLFGRKVGRLKVALLRSTVSILDEIVNLDTLTIVAEDVQYTFTNLTNRLRINFVPPNGVNMDEVKSIVFYDTENNDKFAYISKNVAELPSGSKLRPWFISPTYSQ